MTEPLSVAALEKIHPGAAGFYLALIARWPEDEIKVTRKDLRYEIKFDQGTISRHLSALVNANWIDRKIMGKGSERKICIRFLLENRMPPSRLQGCEESDFAG